MDAPNTSPRSSPYGSCQGEPPTAPVTTRPETDSAPTPSVPAAEPPVRAFGSYELLEEIDRGGMGVVFKARQAGLDRLVALKMILSGPAAQREEVLRFLREARAAGRLRHPNIIAVHDAGTIDGQHYFTMPLARNGSLAQHVKRLGADPRAAVALVEKVARAVQHAHDNGIVHRDLKPANVLLDEGDEPWVADFGLAKVEGADELRTRTGRGLGTPAYMAPEQSDPGLGRSGPAADVWALGVILYELLAGRRPFRGRHETVLQKIREDAPPRPSRLRPGLDANLEAVVLKCLEKEPARRYPSAGALADDLARWLRGEAPLARPEGAVGRAVRWVRRHPAAAAAGVALLALALALPFLWRPRATPVNTSAPEAPGQPAAPDADLRRRLARREPVELIGPTGAPRHPYRYAVGQAPPEPVLGLDGTFTDQTWGFDLVELAAAVPWEEYRLRAEVKTHENKGGRVGIYVAYRRGAAAEGTDHSCCALLYADRPQGHPDEARVEMELRWYGEPWQLPRLNARATPRALFVPLPAAGDDGWRPLALEVTRGGVRGSWWGAGAFDRLAWDDVRPFAEGLARDPPAPKAPPEFPPGGGAGLYVLRAWASFRNVVLEPLGPK
jgi:serine/threonine-protein kinase